MPEATETIELPPGEKVAINRMADKFHEAMKVTQPTPAQPVQSNVEPEIPDIPKTHKDWKALKAVKDRAIEEAKAAKAELEKLKAQKQTPSQQAQPVEPAEPVLAEENGDPALPPEIPPQSKARQAFERLKQIKDKAAKDYEKTKAELETIKKQGAPELEALKKEIAARDLIVKQLAIEKTPQFQNYFSEKFSNALVEAKAAAGEDAAEQLEQIFQLPPSPHRDKQIEDLAEALDLSDMRRLDLLDSYKSLKRSEREKQAELAKAPANFEIIKAQAAKAQQERELQQTRERALLFRHIADSIASDLTGADATLSQSILTDVKLFVDGRADTALYARTLADAARWRRHESTLKQQAEHIEKLEGQLAEMQSANPSLRSNGGAVVHKQLPPLNNSDLGDKFRAAAGKQNFRHAA